MKNAFTINATTSEAGLNKFRVKKLSDDLEHVMDRSDETVENIKRASSIPRWLNLAAAILGMAGMAIVIGFLRALTEVSFSTAYNNAGWLLYVGGPCVLVALAIFIYKTYRNRTTVNSPAARDAFAEQERLNARCFEDLGVPQTADDIDVFCEVFKEKNGKAKKVWSIYQYINISLKIYRDGENLYLADTDGVYAFPISSFFEIMTVRKSALFSGWNKDEPFNKPPYKQYKVRRNNYGVLFVKPHYYIKFIAFNEEYVLVIPSYELETLQKYLTLNII
ncbi:MAG: hypothetical protein J1G04_05580 [Clostridiales bacterium]|nr:hypothetical protein [Clostridiales bacterium]